MWLGGADPGPIREMTRNKPDGSVLKWTMTTLMPAAGARPWLIDWGATASPALSSPKGCKLVGLSCHGRQRQTGAMQTLLATMGLQPLAASGRAVEFCGQADETSSMSIERGYLVATLDTPKGRVQFGDGRW